MASKQECDAFAAQMAHRFEEYVRWAIENWPNKEFPLLESDFDAARKELGEILGPKLSQAEDSASASKGESEPPQFVNVNPMPWP